MHRNQNTHPTAKTTPRPTRRTVVNAAAWAAPVITLAVAAPQASASTPVAYDAEAFGLQRGSASRLFTADLTGVYSVTDPGGFFILNHGTEAIPAGTTASLTYDNRVFSPTTFEARMGDITVPITPSAPVVTGNSSTVSFTIPLEIQPNSSYTDPAAVAILTHTALLNAYPNDAIDDFVPTRHIIILDDANPGNNELGPWGASPITPATPWGVDIERTWAPYSWNGGSCNAEFVASATMTSVGPNPTRASDQVMVAYDYRITSAVTATNVTLNGVPAPGLLTPDTQTYSGYTLFNVNQALAVGDILAAAFDYVQLPNPGSLSDIRRIGLQWWPVDHLNDGNDRAPDTVEEMYRSNASCSL